MRKSIGFILSIKMLAVSNFVQAAPSSYVECINCVAEKNSSSNIYEEIELDFGYQIIGDFIRNSDKSVKTLLTHRQARRECKKRGSRLPTAREFAKEAEVFGGKLLESSDYEHERIPLDSQRKFFYPVRFVDFQGNSDKFYYSRENYIRPLEDDLGTYLSWTSSLNPGNSTEAWVFSGKGGGFSIIVRGTRYHKVGVRCILNSVHPREYFKTSQNLY